MGNKNLSVFYLRAIKYAQTTETFNLGGGCVVETKISVSSE